MNFRHCGTERPVSFNYDRARLECLVELAYTWRMKALPRHHLKRWYKASIDYSMDELEGAAKRLMTRERMPCLADLLRELRVGREARPRVRLEIPSCPKCRNGYRSERDAEGRWYAIRCCAPA